MKSTIRFISAITFSLAALSAQAATLTVGDNLMIESINGLPVSGEPVQLVAGKHMVELRFSDRYYTNAKSSGNWVTSAPLFTQISLTEHETLSLHTPKLSTKAQAQEYIRQPVVTLTSENGRNENLSLQTQAQLMSQLLAGM
ncbi:MAG: DUF2057 domain-containing protein [Shewanella sp.]|nr:DUF2057 domain-containing protein [Shewanella sp.]MCF1430235.1 DUF2057 domain-containing protein [Shewanella sp.]MCF1438342.1 DUF2057 domain-containing protein [Shewanella sp.]MCF1457485.1 DUF2057 domain-containing protein [Shewanella sp.]